MELIKFEKNTQEDEIFKKLKGKDFLAISVYSTSDGANRFEFHINHMADEFIILGLELLKQQILESIE